MPKSNASILPGALAILAATVHAAPWARSPAAAGNAAGGSPVESAAPSAPSGLLLVNQGGPRDYDNPTGQREALTDYQAIQWTAATAGAYPVDHYEIYRNGVAYARVSAPTRFRGYISGKKLKVTRVISGTVIPGPRYAGAGIAAGTLIDGPQLTGWRGRAGTYPVNISQSAGSRRSPVTFTAWVFIDTAARDSNGPFFDTATTTYSYAVAAVDTHGHEGPLTAQYAVYGYEDGQSNWDDYNFDYGAETSNFDSTAGGPRGGQDDLEAKFTGGGGVNLVAGSPQAPVDDLDIGAFNYFTIDINPGPTVGYTIGVSNVSRLPIGDVYGWKAGLVRVFDYGPRPIANTWATYKIPLSALGIGRCTFTGSISGTTLTVTRVDSGPAIVDAGGFITGPGVPAGTYILGFGQRGPIGTFTIAGRGIRPSTRVPTETMSYQRTAFYKSTIQPSVVPITFYIDNFGWLAR